VITVWLQYHDRHHTLKPSAWPWWAHAGSAMFRWPEFAVNFPNLFCRFLHCLFHCHTCSKRHRRAYVSICVHKTR